MPRMSGQSRRKPATDRRANGADADLPPNAMGDILRNRQLTREVTNRERDKVQDYAPSASRINVASADGSPRWGTPHGPPRLMNSLLLCAGNAVIYSRRDRHGRQTLSRRSRRRATPRQWRPERNADFRRQTRSALSAADHGSIDCLQRGTSRRIAERRVLKCCAACACASRQASARHASS